MLPKSNEKNKAVKLRKSGFSYSEILKQIPVAKSTLSLWLNSVKLSKNQQQRLTEKKLAAMERGWQSYRRKKNLIAEETKEKARKDISLLSERDSWLIGTALYWGEGSKEKKHSPGVGVRFSNSDSSMIMFFVNWLISIVRVPREELYFELYIHENYRHRLKKVIKYWAQKTNFPESTFSRIYFKKNKIKTNRKNTGDDYYGLIRIVVRKSSNLNRKIQGWIEGINQHCGVV